MNLEDNNNPNINALSFDFDTNSYYDYSLNSEYDLQNVFHLKERNSKDFFNNNDDDDNDYCNEDDNNNENDINLTTVKQLTQSEDQKSISASTNLLSTKTKRDDLDSKDKREVYLKKNRESAKKCRDKRKQEIQTIIKDNQLLTQQINALKKKLKQLCPKCKSLLNITEPPSNTTKTKFIISNGVSSPSSPLTTAYRPNANKQIGLVAGSIVLLCVFSTLMSIQSNLFNSNNTNSAFRVRTLSESSSPNNQKSGLYNFTTQSYRTDHTPKGPYVSFGDYYTIRTKNTFLSKKYDLINNGKIRVVNDTTVAEKNMTECENCIVEISEKHQIRKKNDLIYFTLLIPFTSNNEKETNSNQTYLFYQVDCMAIGFQQNQYFP